MPLLFLVAGLILIITVVRGTFSDFSATLGQDLSGGYLKWLAAILVIGGLGYIGPLKEPSRYLMGLVALVVLLTKGSGFISMFAQQVQNPGQASYTPPGGNANLPAFPVQSVPSSATGGVAGGGVLGGISGALQQQQGNPFGSVLQAAPAIASILPQL